MNLSAQNEALLMKHLFKLYNKADIPWVNHLELLHQYPSSYIEAHGILLVRDVYKIDHKYRQQAS